MADSILDTIKQMLGVPTSDTAFDTDIIVGINSALMALNQLGIGPETVFTITDKTTEWTDFLEEPTNYPSVQTYIFLKTKLIFDPPIVSFHVTAIENQILELGWRLMVQVPIPPDPVV
jgi:hypothetical protein